MPQTIEIVATVLFAVAVLHTFSVSFFARLAHRDGPHAGIWHMLSEVEAVFGVWAFVLLVCMALLGGTHSAIEYMDTRNFTEPLFVFAIMVVAASRPILELVSLLLRAADIPVRVVVGYQGGSWNPLENYLLVSQSDAHAWTEVWIEGEGWRNIDPTAAVAPNRIEQGLDNALSADEQNLVNSNWSGSALLYNLRLRWDAATFVWQRWVLNYDSQTQEGLLSRLLGGTEAWRMTLWLIGLGLLGAALATWTLLRSHQGPALRPEIRALQSLERDAGAGARSADDAGRRLTVGVYVYAEHDRQR